MWYKVKDATSAIANVDDYSGSAKLLAATTLRSNAKLNHLRIESYYFQECSWN